MGTDGETRMSKSTGAQHLTKKASTGTRVPAKVREDERRQVVIRATSRVKTARSVDTTKVLRG